MSAAEQAERIRGAGSRRAGLIIFVLEEALQAAGVATVADLAGDFPGSRTNALTSEVVIACRLINSGERSPRCPRKVASGFARRVGKSAPLEVRKDQLPVGVPRSSATDGGPGIRFGLDSWRKRERGCGWPPRCLLGQNVCALITADANMGANFRNAGGAPTGAGGKGYGAQEGNVRMLTDGGGLEAGLADKENRGEAICQNVQGDGRARGGFNAGVNKGPPDG